MAHGGVKLMAAIGAGLLGWAGMICPRRKSPDRLKCLQNYDYAHRGYHDENQGIPENSMAAFGRAVENGFGIELDVHLSKDHHLVVMHDSSLKRMCGIDERVEDLDWDTLQGYRLQDTQERIPRLEQVLERVDGRIPMIIEVKPEDGNYGELCHRTCQALRHYKGLYCIESFDPRAVAWLRKHEPEIVRGQLLMNMHKHGVQEQSRILDFVLRNLWTNCWTRPDFIAYHVKDRDNPSLKLCRKLYHVCEVDWTIRDKEEYSQVKRDGAIAIFEHLDPRGVCH